jgi:hypothetical protein
VERNGNLRESDGTFAERIGNLLELDASSPEPNSVPAGRGANLAERAGLSVEPNRI